MERTEAKPQRQSQVAEQTNRLEGNLTTLHNSIDKLQDRLSSVLRSSVLLEQEIGKDKDSEELVNLALIIEGFGDSVRSANYKIEDILERIEL